jgi:alpha-galactosidase
MVTTIKLGPHKCPSWLPAGRSNFPVDLACQLPTQEITVPTMRSDEECPRWVWKASALVVLPTGLIERVENSMVSGRDVCIHSAAELGDAVAHGHNSQRREWSSSDSDPEEGRQHPQARRCFSHLTTLHPTVHSELNSCLFDRIWKISDIGMAAVGGLLLFSALCVGSIYAAAPSTSWAVTSTDSGRFTLAFGGSAVLKLACPSIKVQPNKDTIELCAAKYYSRAVLSNTTRGTDPNLGAYTEQTIKYTSNSGIAPSSTMLFRYFDAPSRVMHVRLLFDQAISTNWISPFEGTWDLGEPAKEPRFLRVPQDSDIQSSYASISASGLLSSGSSSFVTSIHDLATGAGLVVGFLEHSMWKSGVHFRHNTIQAVAGLNGKLLTRDYSMPHGTVQATSSPLLSIGVYEDWRDGMEEYARMQLDSEGRPQGKPVPLPAGLNLTNAPVSGWNSWAMTAGLPTGEGITNLTTLYAASEVLGHLRTQGFGPSSIIARDAIYGLNESQTLEWVAHIKANGQIPGTYDSPVAYYGDPKTHPNYTGCFGETGDPCTPGDNCWPTKDIVLKDDKGEYIHSLAQPNQYIRDVSHPAFLCHLKVSVEEQIRQGYLLIKQDFWNLAAYEGVHHNTSMCPTGMAAYTRALNLLAEVVAGRAMIDYGISLPLPVGPAGHARHIGCEQMFGGVEYGMNQFGGGWWQNQLYTWLDPDLVTFRGDFWFRPWKKLHFTKMLSMDSKSRVNKAVVYGGLFKNGDDLSNTTSAATAVKFLGNAKVNAMWARAGIGQTFRPASWDGAEGMAFLLAPSVYTRKNGDVAVFNYAPWEKNFIVDLRDAGFPSNITGVVCAEVWEGTAIKPERYTLKVTIPKGSSMLFECRV